MLALFLLHGRDLKCICNDTTVSFSAELSRRRGSLPRRQRGGDPASPILRCFGGGAPACICVGQPLSWGARVPLHRHFSPRPHSAPFPSFPMVAFGDLTWSRSDKSCGRGSPAGAGCRSLPVLPASSPAGITGFDFLPQVVELKSEWIRSPFFTPPMLSLQNKGFPNLDVLLCA